MTIDADFDQAIAHHQAGRFSEAESLYRNIIALNSKHAGALLHLGLIAHQSGKNPAALELIDQAIAAKPKYAEAHYNRGTILHLDKQLEKAAESFRQAARLDNNHIGALYSLAGVQRLLGQSDRAIKNYQTAAKKAPDQPEIHINLAVVFYETQRFEDALKSVEKALSLDPQSVEANFTRGNILAELHRTKEALNCYDMLLENDPDNTLILINKAAALQESNDPGEALAIYDQIIKLLPDQSEPVSSKANVLVKMARLDEAIETFVQALAIAPTQAQTLYNQANLLLLLGGFDEGFPGLEKRFENEDNLENWERDGLKFWQGEELSGPLYLRAEQGVGDHLLWSTQIPQLQERGYDIVFECDPRLVSLIARSFPRVKVIAEGSKLKEKSDAARQIGMASVPYCLADWSETFTPQNRVFEPDGDTAENLANELFSVADGRPIIGTSWRSARRKVGPQKSLPLDHCSSTPVLRRVLSITSPPLRLLRQNFRAGRGTPRTTVPKDRPRRRTARSGLGTCAIPNLPKNNRSHLIRIGLSLSQHQILVYNHGHGPRITRTTPFIAQVEPIDVVADARLKSRSPQTFGRTVAVLLSRWEGADPGPTLTVWASSSKACDCKNLSRTVNADRTIMADSDLISRPPWGPLWLSSGNALRPRRGRPKILPAPSRHWHGPERGIVMRSCSQIPPPAALCPRSCAIPAPDRPSRSELDAAPGPGGSPRSISRGW